MILMVAMGTLFSEQRSIKLFVKLFLLSYSGIVLMLRDRLFQIFGAANLFLLLLDLISD